MVVLVVAVLAFDENKLAQRFAVFEITFGKVSDWFYDALGNKRGVEKRGLTISTALLDIEAVEIDTGLTVGLGGGLTSFRNQVVLLTGEGQLYIVGNDRLHATRVSTPPFNRKSMEKHVANRNSNAKVKELRYNDVLFSELLDPNALFVSYSYWNAEEACYANRVARLEIDPGIASLSEMSATSEDWRILYETRPCLPLKEKSEAFVGRQAGGRMAALGPNNMLLTVGDFGFDGVNSNEAHPQLPNSDYGKVLQLDTRTGRATIFSSGHRNPQGILVDDRGTIWSVEHGPQGGDELNRIRAGHDYGWPQVTYGTDYGTYRWPLSEQQGRHDGFTTAVYAWVPSVAVSNLIQIKGFSAEWDRDLLVASLRRGWLFRLRLDGDRVVYSEPIPIGERIRYVHQHDDGRIFLWTDKRKIFILSPAQGSATDSRIEDALSSYGAEDRAAIKAAFKSCVECHSIDPGRHQTAPSLAGVFGRRMGSASYEGYSPALRARDEVWQDENLKSFVMAPERFAAGTTMVVPGVASDDIAKGIVAILKGL
jgi:cytochrome c2